jgi:hypothetical protein
MKSILFVTAVFAASADIANLKPQGFSIHDITKRLREQTANGDVEFSDRTREDVDGTYTFRVDHSEVKNVFNELFEAGLNLALDKKWSNGFFIYVRKADDDDDTFNHAVGGTAIQHPATNVIPFPTPSATSATDQEILDKTNVYLGKFTSGDEISMKQIQSRFKGISKTCEQYADLLENAGHRIDRVGDSASKWVLVVD